MDERVALITGGTRGIGRAIALRLARVGVTPVMTYLSNREAADEALGLCKALRPDARIFAVDLRSPEQIQDTVDRTLDAFGRIDILINNAFASSGAPKKTHELPFEVWTRSINSNLGGAFSMSRACLPSMIAHRSGRIIFIGSLAMRGEPGRSAYAVSKAGLVALAQTIALEYAQDGITANVVSPGFVNAGAFLQLSQEIRDRAAKTVPMKRLAEADEIAEAVLYFTSPESAYTTGQVLGVNGGAR